MKKIKYFAQFAFIIVVQFMLLWSCKDSKEAPPFPVYENEYEQPEVVDFNFSETEKVEWKTLDPSKIKISQPVKYNWSKLPSKPFDIGISYPLQGTIEKKEFDWSKLTRSDFNFDELPSVELEVVTKILGEPTIVKAGQPINGANSSRGVMSIDTNFGLPTEANSILLDNNGLIWFGAANGIARYDAGDLEIYGAQQGLNALNVSDMFQDSKGRLWVHTYSNNLSVIDFEANLIHEINSPFHGLNRHGMMETADGTFWYAALNDGYRILDFEARKVKRLSIEEGLVGNFNINSIQDNEGRIWVSTDKGINIFDIKGGKKITFTEKDGLLSNFVGSIYQNEEGEIWITGGGGITILNKNNSEVSYLKIENGLIGAGGFSNVFQDRSGTYWMGTANGLIFSFDKVNGFLRKYVLNGAPNNWVYQIVEDDQGEIWASIAQGGMYKINRSNGMPSNFSMSDGLSSNDMWATLEDRSGKIWIGSRQGIDVFDPEENIIKHLNIAQGLFHPSSTRLDTDSRGRIWVTGITKGVSIVDYENQTIQTLELSEDVAEGMLISFVEITDDVYWLGTNEGEILKVDLANDIFKSVVIDSTKENGGNNRMFKDLKGRIWVGTLESGIEIYDIENNTMSRLSAENELISDRIYSVEPDASNNIWVAGQDGVSLINVKDQTFTNFNIAQGLGANDVYAIGEGKNEIFLGTSNGLTILKPNKIEGNDVTYWNVKTIGSNQGLDLVDFAENSFTFDRNGRFWGSLVETMTLIDEIKVDSAQIPSYVTGLNILDNPQSFKNLDLIASKMNISDTVWVKGKKGFRSIRKSEMDSIYKLQEGIEWKTVQGPYNMPVGLTLPHTLNYLSFTYGSPHFSNPDKVVFRYILEGIDKNWSPVTDKTTSENYRDLPPGDYNFMVASKGFNGIWSDPAELKFTILPPWWQTWWAYTVFVALFLGLGLVILHYRSRWLKKENKILEDRVNERTSELKKTISELENTQSQLIQSEKMASLGELTAGIAHEIQNPMNFINNFSEVTIELVDEMCEELEKGEVNEAKDISKDIIQNLGKITHHGKRASSIVKGMLEHSRNSSGKKEFIDLNVLSDEYLRLAYHGLRAKDKSFNADFKTDFDETLPKVEIIPQDLGRVVLNIINNAFFAVTSIPEEQRDENYKPLVTVSTKNLKNQARISIKDNGPGIPEDIKDKIFQPFFTTKATGKGTGLGLSLAYDIVTTGHGGAIELNTELGKGTEFVIYIPIKK